MRLVSTILLSVIFACLLLAQAPIGFGPGTVSPGLLNYFDWYTATASGCTAGTRGMCVGSQPVGDTVYFSGWFANASLLPVTTGLPIVGTLNDFNSKTCGGNLMVIQLAEFDWAARNASRIYEVNCMSSYGTASSQINVPVGWYGHCTDNDNNSDACAWKSRQPFVRNGLLYLPVERQISTGALSIHDATIIVSADGGQTWKNPYTVAHSGVAQADGDAPKCGAAGSGAGHPCTDTAYADSTHSSMMWKALPNLNSQWEPVQYGQDGDYPSGVTDGCDPATYSCFFGGEAEVTLARVPNASIMDVSTWQYYTCPTITQSYRCPGGDSASWTSTLANRTPLTRFRGRFSAAYIKEFKTYLYSGYYTYPSGAEGTDFWTAPTIQGPWTQVHANKTVLPGFTTPALGLGYTVVSTNPPHVKLTTAGDSHGVHISQGTPIFAQWDLILGRTPMMQGGENPRYNNVGGVVENAGYVLSDSHAAGTIPRKDLTWAFDFYDHGGNASSGINGFHDIANGSAYLAVCTNASFCGFWNPGQGSTLTSFGGTLSYGYGARLTTMMSDNMQTVADTATKKYNSYLTTLNAPAAIQGNGTYTVAGVFRYDGAGYNTVPLWTTGDTSGTNTAVFLGYAATDGSSLELGWGSVNANRWRYNSGFSLVAGNWYFIACTVQASGATPVAHMWMGVGGLLVDKIAGVSRASTGGSPTQTPNVAAAPITIGLEPGQDYTTNASYAGLFVYSRALGQAEAGLMYKTVKTKMAARGVTLQ